MFKKIWPPMFKILEESPLFTELSVPEREKLVQDLIKEYPYLKSHPISDSYVGYEASWLMNKGS